LTRITWVAEDAPLAPTQPGSESRVAPIPETGTRAPCVLPGNTVSYRRRATFRQPS
jgi:hypothetical protein